MYNCRISKSDQRQRTSARASEFSYHGVNRFSVGYVYDALVGGENLYGAGVATTTLSFALHQLAPGDLIDPAVIVVHGAADA